MSQENVVTVYAGLGNEYQQPQQTLRVIKPELNQVVNEQLSFSKQFELADTKLIGSGGGIRGYENGMILTPNGDVLKYLQGDQFEYIGQVNEEGVVVSTSDTGSIYARNSNQFNPELVEFPNNLFRNRLTAQEQKARLEATGKKQLFVDEDKVPVFTLDGLLNNLSRGKEEKLGRFRIYDNENNQVYHGEGIALARGEVLHTYDGEVFSIVAEKISDDRYIMSRDNLTELRHGIDGRLVPMNNNF